MVESGFRMNIKQVNQGMVEDWIELSNLLYPYLTKEEMRQECLEFLETKQEIGFLYEHEGKYVAFMNVSVRNDYVNGTTTSPVLYIEAIYVKEPYRRQGIGKALITFAEQYAHELGITQIASDCLIDNQASEAFHKSCQFEEKERVICFVKDVKVGKEVSH